MKEISEEAKLSTKYTNHCVRATAITLWSNAGISNRQIMAITGHRNEQSLRSYNSRPSSAQLQQSSDVLSRALETTSHGFQFHMTSFNGQEANSSSQTNSIAQSNTFYKNPTFTNMFSGCSIGTVQVCVNSRQGFEETPNK